MLKKPLFIYLLLLFNLGGCELSTRTNTYSATYTPNYQNRPLIKTSLFVDDQNIISNETVNKILGGKINFPDTLNIAVVDTSEAIPSLFGYRANNLLTLRSYLQKPLQEINNEITELKKNEISNIKKIEYSLPDLQVTQVPDILLGQQNLTASHLRSAATRLQTELILIYNIKHNYSYSYHLFSKNTSLVRSNIQAMLLDTRTGIVLFTVLIDGKKRNEENNEDGEFDSFKERSLQDATNRIIAELGIRIAMFLIEGKNKTTLENTKKEN